MNQFKNFASLIHPKIWPAWFLLLFLWFVTKLPDSWQFQIGKALGKLLYRIPGKLKSITETNIKLCFPTYSEKQKITLAKKNFESLGIGIIESVRAWWLPKHKLNESFDLIGLEHAEAAFKKGNGIILVSPHFFCLEMIGRILGMKYDFAVMYRPHKKKIISFIHEKFRKKNVARHIPNHKLRELIKTLNENMAVWYAYDIDGGGKSSVFAPFFNIQTSSLTSVSRLVTMSQAAVVPIYFFRKPNSFQYEIILSPELDNFPSGDLVADATRLNKILEKGILRQPEQYIWQYKRFKTRPAGEMKLY